MQNEILLIWQLLHEFDVHYLTIGGFAVNYHGYNRSTGDIDLLIEDSMENSKKRIYLAAIVNERYRILFHCISPLKTQLHKTNWIKQVSDTSSGN